MSEFYVYELVDPRDGAVFYVGKGKGPRMHQHEKEARAGRSGRKAEKIREIEASGLSVIKRKVATFGNAADALRREAELINEYGLASLTNVMPGGAGAVKFSKADDAAFVGEFAKLMRRTCGYAIGVVWVMGCIPVNLEPAFSRFEKHLRAIIERRGRKWVDAISGKHHVRFA